MAELLADVLVAVAAVMLTAGVVATLLAVTALWAMRRRNRVDPRTPIRAPLRWLWSVGRCARLHRRLRLAALSLRADRAHPLAAQLTGYACALDRRLVGAARLPLSMRVVELPAIAAEVWQVEGLAARLQGQPVTPLPTPTAPALRALAERLDLLDDARREVDAIASVYTT